MVRKKIDGIFVDENLILVGKQLEKLPDIGTVLYPGHPDIPELPLSAKDVEIFEVIGANRRNLLFITRDKRIRTNLKERRRFREAHVRAIIITVRSDMKQIEIYQLICDHWDAIADIDTSKSGPSIHRLRKQGLSEWALPD